MAQEKQRSEALKSLTEKSRKVARCFASPNGQEVLRILEEEFDLDEIFVPGQTDTTSYNLGRRDVVVYIKQLIRLEANGRELEG